MDKRTDTEVKNSIADPSEAPMRTRRIRRFVIAALCAFALAPCTEMFLFNINHWVQSPGPDSAFTVVPQDIESNLPEKNTSDKRSSLPADEIPLPGGIDSSAKAYERVVCDLDNESIHSIAFDVIVNSDPDMADQMTTTVDISDSGWSQGTYNIMSESTPERSVHIETPAKAYGMAKSLVITVWSASTTTQIDIDNIQINVAIPLSISKWRILLAFIMLMLIYLFRPKSSLWKTPYIAKPYIAVGMAAVMLAGCALGIAWGQDDPTSEWGGWRSGARDEYAMLARSIVDDGKLYLQQTPEDYLLSMDDLSDGEDRLSGDRNIFDMSARDKLQEESDSDIKPKLDAAYFDGKYYVYFGVVPAVLTYIPYYMITESDLSNTVVVAIALLVFAIFVYLILDLFVRRKTARVSVAVVCLCYVGIILSTGMVDSIAFPIFYNVPILFGAVLTLIGSYLFMRAYWTDKKNRQILFEFFGAACLIATLGCRPQFTIVALVVGIAYLALSIRKHRISILDIAAAAVPIVAIATGLLFYNYARFGSFFDFGSSYNLTGNDMTLRCFNPVRLIDGFFLYVFGMPHLSMDFPYLHPYFPSSGYYGRVTFERFTFGFATQAPYVIVLFAFLASKKLTRKVKLAICSLIVLAISIIAIDAEMAGVLVRYIQDFGYLIGAAFAIGLLSYDNATAISDSEMAQRETSMQYSETMDTHPRFAPIYMIVFILLLMALLAALLTWLGDFTNLRHYPTSGPYMFDFFKIKHIFDIWGSTITPI